MHTDVNVSVFEFNRRSIRPHFELAQLFGRHVLQCTDPLSRNQEASIAVRDDLDGVPLGHVANSLRPNFDLCFGPAGDKRRGVLGITDPMTIRRHNFTCSLVPSLKRRFTTRCKGTFLSGAMLRSFTVGRRMGKRSATAKRASFSSIALPISDLGIERIPETKDRVSISKGSAANPTSSNLPRTARALTISDIALPLGASLLDARLYPPPAGRGNRAFPVGSSPSTSPMPPSKTVTGTGLLAPQTIPSGVMIRSRR